MSSSYGAPNDDFNWQSRPFNGLWDIGAYEWSQNTNPGWQIQENFKEIYSGISEIETVKTDSNRVHFLISNNVVIFKNLTPGSRIKIYDVSGKLIHDSGKISHEDYKWNTNNSASGLYFCSLKMDRGEIGFAKVIIIR